MALLLKARNLEFTHGFMLLWSKYMTLNVDYSEILYYFPAFIFCRKLIS